MSNALLVFLGAGIGGLLRFYFSNAVHLFFSRDFPYGTLFVNVSGSFLMGILFILVFNRFNDSQPLRVLLLIGLLGGYTTFSSFSLETLIMLESGAWVKAIANIFLSVVLCLAATGCGVLIGKQI